MYTNDPTQQAKATQALTQMSRPQSPFAILASPDDVFRLASTFFATKEEQGKPPTPAGLATFMGFASRAQMMQALNNPKYPEESLHYLAHALTVIEATLSEDALTDKINVPMTKYLMSATLGVVEKKEVKETSDKTIRYVISTAEPSSPEEALEIQRLEEELERQTTAELTLAGKIKPTEESTHNPSIEEELQVMTVSDL